MIVKQKIRFLNYPDRSLAVYLSGSGHDADKHQIISFAVLDRDDNELYRQGDLDIKVDKIDDHEMTI